MRPSWRSLPLGRRCSVATQSNRDCQRSQSERQQPASTAHCPHWYGAFFEAAKLSNGRDLRLNQRRIQAPAGAIIAHLLRGLPVQ
jgi:hypothetical protein